MPAFSTHYIFALELMERLKQSADFPVCENAVYIGAQGPDIFFFHRALPWQKGKTLRAAGSALHRARAGDILDIFADYCKSTENQDIAKSYACGFIMHYALDRTCHPFIYYLQNFITERSKKLNPHSVHNSVELAIDSLMLKLRLGTDSPEAFDTEKTFIYTDTEKEEIARMLARTSAAVSPVCFTEHDVETAIDDTKYAQRLLLDSNGKKKKALKAIETAAAPFTKNFKISSFLRTDDLENAKKYVNINNGGWTSPFDGVKRHESFFELFENAKNDALSITADFLNGVSGGEATQNLSFLTGVKTE